ncbi:chemotaxis protein CheW [Methylophaga sp. OBS4]|uniref:chemotaxis protein CheW n=1 Tax=Methylophaga sp. OBS4 TaxID=2991935 RepID=UPI0022541FDD|nr:chemotaxis protein CheW [Methylophaga sp. OBS4]MCX4188479.1 chemotaxis protein CheW [Methylophaga sp. OBS4]
MSEQLQREQWLCFQVDDETYAHPVDTVREIFSYSKPVPVPGAQASVEGVLNVRGDIVTIVSCRHLLELKHEPNLSGHIIIIETAAGLIGITVDRVDQIRLLQCEDMVATEHSPEQSPVSGTILHQQQLLILTDFNRCVNQLENYE